MALVMQCKADLAIDMTRQQDDAGAAGCDVNVGCNEYD